MYPQVLSIHDSDPGVIVDQLNAWKEEQDESYEKSAVDS